MVTALTEDNSQYFELIKNLNLINKDSIALDIGACIGSFTKFLAENCKLVFAFEPSPYNFDKLQQNTKDYSNIIYFQVAVGQIDRISTLYLCPNDIGMNRLYNSKWCKGGKRVKIIQRELDKMMLPYGYLKELDFVKIDVEGYEYFAISGMARLLVKYHPTVMMEFHPPSMEEAGSEPSRLYHFMMDIGYNPPLICHDLEKKINSYADLDYICRNRAAVNILFT